MSTADSALIGVSNTMSCDIFKNWLTPNLDSYKIVWIGKGISIVTMGISIGIAAYLYESGIDYGSILTLQQAILWQAFPAYIFGMYTNINYRSVLLGIIMGLICDIILISIVYSDEGANDPFVKSDPSLAALDKAWSSLVGVLLNIIGCAIGHWGLRWRASDEYDPNHNENAIGTLNIWKIRDIMKNVQEPMIKYYGLPVYFMGACAMIACFHWIGEIDPELIEEFGEDTVKTFLYNGKVQDVIGGLPSWTFASIMWFMIGTLSGIYATTLWKVDKSCEGEGESNLTKKKVRTNTDDMNEIEMMKKQDETTALSDDGGMEQQSNIISADI